ncbi:MAG: hypothetical protein NTZ69_09325 [Bacteroidia bacterium]|nr:hypothetical protein [Bacteroidia bacterium]
MKPDSTNSMKTPRIIARVMSAIIVAFALMMFIGETMESAKRGTSSTMTLNTIIQLALFGIGLVGLVLAWKWESIGGIISLLAFITIFIVNPRALLWPMFIFPTIAILFIVVGYRSKILDKKIR